MKITKYTKKKDNLYEIVLANEEHLTLYGDTILKYDLLNNNEIKQDLLKEIIDFNNQIVAYNISLKYILSKLRTEKEIRNKLKNYSLDIQEYAIKKLKDEGYLNDELYIKSYTNDAINLKFIGPNKIKYELKKLGFAEDLVEDYLSTIDLSTWLEKINKYINKKITTNNKLSSIMLKNKIMDDLLNKGFYKEDISNCLNNFNFKDNVDIYEREYEKLRNKLSNKYKDEYLDYYIKINLRKKGFNFED